MAHVMRPAATAACCLCALLAHAAAADSPCFKGYRDTTASERANMTRVLEAARRALPPAPPGWMIVNDDPPRVPASLCQDLERRPWAYDYSRTYRRTDKQAQIEETLQAVALILQQDQARKQPRLAALQARSEALSRQQIALVEKGDMARAVALNEQMAALQSETLAIMEEGDARARTDAMMKEAYRDIEIAVTVQVNPYSVAPAEAGSTELAVAGNPAAAYRWDSRDPDSYQGGALVLYGPWQPRSQGGLRMVGRSHVPANFVHGIFVSVHADEKRLPSVLSAIDFAAIAGLVAP